MTALDKLNEKIAAAREAGRDVPPVIAELLQSLAEAFDPSAEEKPVEKAEKPAPAVEEKAAEQVAEKPATATATDLSPSVI